MTIQSDKELQEWIESQRAIDYTTEYVQKRTILSYEQGGNITLYDWIHRYDNSEPAYIVDLDDVSADWVIKFRKAFTEAVNNG